MLRTARRSRFTPGWAVLLTLLASGGASAQPAPRPGEVTQVTISAPLGTAQQPFRTSFSQLAIAFAHNGGNTGFFVAQSLGADVNATNFLINESSGAVGAFFSTNGLKTLSVRVTAQTSGSSAVSQPTFLVFDNVAPVISLQQIRIDPRLPFETFVPGKVYHTSADAIGLKGFVTDGAMGTPPEQITLTGRAGAGDATATPDAGGQFEISISLAGLPDGPGEIRLTAADKMSDNSRPNVGKAPGVRLGE